MKFWFQPKCISHFRCLEGKKFVPDTNYDLLIYSYSSEHKHVYKGDCLKLLSLLLLS